MNERSVELFVAHVALTLERRGRGLVSDFVDFESKAQALTSRETVGIRAAVLTDVDALAAVMSVCGGTIVDHVESAGHLIERFPVLLIAQAGGTAVGWCGTQKFSIFPGADPEWLIAGLAVVPE